MSRVSLSTLLLSLFFSPIALNVSRRDTQIDNYKLTVLSMQQLPKFQTLRASAQTTPEPEREAGRLFEQREVDRLLEQGFTPASEEQLDEVLKSLQEDLRISKESGNRYDEAMVMSMMSTIYNIKGQYKEAIEYNQQSLKIAKEIGNRELELVLSISLGYSYDIQGKDDKAIEAYQKSLTVAKELNDLDNEWFLLMMLGSKYSSHSQYEKAIEYHQKSVAIAKELGDSESEAIALDNLGSAYKSLEQYQKAIESYKQAVDIIESIRPSWQGQPLELQETNLKRVTPTYRNLAQLLQQQGRSQEAQQVLELLQKQ